MNEYQLKYSRRPLSPAQREMYDAIVDGGGKASVSYSRRVSERFYVTTRRGWGSSQRRTWEALVNRALVRETEDWDHIGHWWEVVPEEERDT